LAGSSTFSVTINSTITPVTGFTYTSPVCANNANILPTPDPGFTAGGTYSSTAGLSINASTGEITVTTSTPGTYVVTYAVTASGCQLAGSSTFSVTINSTITPVTGFTYTSPVCANNANILPTPDPGFTAGGTYSSTAGLSINASTGEITVTTSTPGTYVVTYAVTAAGCQLAGSSTFSVTINSTITPVTGFTYTSPVCANNANILPTPDPGFTAGGTYSSTAGLSINASTGEITVTTSTPGTYVVTYAVTASGCQLAGSSTFSVTINSTITPVTGFTYTSPVCANNANILPTPDPGFTAGGTYSSTAGLTINASTGEITVTTSTPGTYVVTYAVTAAGCQLAGSSTFSVTINSTITPVTGFTYTSPVCANNANILPTPDPGFTAGGTYSSTAGLTINASTGEIDVVASTPGTYVVTYAVTAAGCQLAGSSTFSVTINSTITPVTGFTYTTPVCANNANLLPTTDPGFTAGGTYSSTAGLTINTSTGEIDVVASTPGTYVVTYAVTAAGCQLAGNSTFSVTINSTITPVTGFTYTTPVCANNANLLPTTDPGFTAGGTYSSTAGLTINTSTGEIDVVASTPGTYVVTYAVTAAGCQLAGNSTFSVTINSTITPVTGFTYTTPVCANNANLLPTTDPGFTAGGTYSSTAGLTINTSTGEIDVVASTPGTYVVTYAVTAAGCQLSGSSTFSVTITPTPTTSPIFHD
jgi:Holliday junction resolvase-like predicted endonuclease